MKVKVQRPERRVLAALILPSALNCHFHGVSQHWAARHPRSTFILGSTEADLLKCTESGESTDVIILTHFKIEGMAQKIRVIR